MTAGTSDNHPSVEAENTTTLMSFNLQILFALYFIIIVCIVVKTFNVKLLHGSYDALAAWNVIVPQILSGYRNTQIFV